MSVPDPSVTDWVPLWSVGPAVSTDGWNALTGAWTFGTADGHTFTMTAPVDVTAAISPGCRVKLTHAGVTKYFLVTAAAFASGSTTLTLYGGTDYTLAATAITNVFSSRDKAPHGFPLDPAKWTDELVDSTFRSQAAAVLNQWYNLAPLSLAVPIGIWRLYYSATVYAAGRTAVSTLSTTNNGETDTTMSVTHEAQVSTETEVQRHRERFVTLAAKTTYYLNVKTGVAGYMIGFDGVTIIRAVSAYL